MRVGKLLTAIPLLSVPLLVVPAICFAVSRPVFLWSVIALGLTAWRMRSEASTTAKQVTLVEQGSFAKLIAATIVLQLLAFAWIGAVWLLQGLNIVVTHSPFSSRIVGWIQGQWFAVPAAWLVLFVVVSGLCRLSQPLMCWHRRGVQRAAAVFVPKNSEL